MHIFEFMFFKISQQKVFREIDIIQIVPQKDLWKSSVLVNLLYAFSSIKDELLLMHFKRKLF